MSYIYNTIICMSVVKKVCFEAYSLKPAVPSMNALPKVSPYLPFPYTDNTYTYLLSTYTPHAITTISGI